MNNQTRNVDVSCNHKKCKNKNEEWAQPNVKLPIRQQADHLHSAEKIKFDLIWYDNIGPTDMPTIKLKITFTISPPEKLYPAFRQSPSCRNLTNTRTVERSYTLHMIETLLA
jgi:hypothetical protein